MSYIHGHISRTGGSGNVLGASSSTDNAAVRFDGTTGKRLKDSPLIIDDSGNLSGIGNITATGQVRLSQAAVATPALKLQASEETGVTSFAGGTLSIVRAGAENSRFDSGGITLYQGTYIRPSSNNARDLGQDALRWRDLFLAGDLDHGGANVGFYGTTPIAQQTGVAVTAAGVHAALVNLGLITA